MRLFISKLAQELLGDDLAKLDALARREIKWIMTQGGGGGFMHCAALSEDARARGDIYIVDGKIEGGEVKAYICRGYWTTIRAPDDARAPEVRGQEYKVPVPVEHADNNKFREITEKDRQQ